MRTLMISILALVATCAETQIAHRDLPGTRFENDIRANNEALSRRFSGPNNQVETQNTRMRERLNATKGTGLRSR